MRTIIILASSITIGVVGMAANFVEHIAARMQAEKN